LPEGDATVTIRNVDTGAKLHEFKSDQPVTSSSLSGDGKTLVTVGKGKNTSVVTVRNVDTGAELQKFEHDQVVTSLSLSGDGKTLVAVEHDELCGSGLPTGAATVTIRNVDNGAKLQEFKSEQPVTSSSLSGDGKTLETVEHGSSHATYGFPEGDATVTIRKVDNGAKLQEFKGFLLPVEHGKRR